ncbi:MAG: ABC transporter substrate-binding protein [Eubacteriales bacterium]|nr:ABC transporter substrate-binding protein [Eubacteriales bacterium]
MRIRLLAGGILVAAAVALSACSLPFGGTGSSDGAGQASTQELAGEILGEEPLMDQVEDDGKYHIGILTYLDHGASEETIRGFESEFRTMLGTREVEFDVVSADGDLEKCARIATEFANTGHQLIFACGTEAVQNAGAAVHDVPIIGGCVTDYLLSGVVSSVDAPGGNITGVSCLGPIDAQMDQIQRLSSWPTMVGIVSSGTEVGSKFQESIAGQCLTEDQVSWKSYHAATENGLRRAMELAAAECSCIYLPTDNFVASHMDIVRDVMLATGVPVATGDYQMCGAGGLYCCSIDYYEHGKKAAEMAFDVLENGEEISRMSIRKEEEWQEYYNPYTAERLEWYSYGNMTPLNVEMQEETPDAGTTEENAPEYPESGENGQ